MPVNLFENPPAPRQPVNLFGTPPKAPAAAPSTLQGKLGANPSYGAQVGAEDVGGINKIGSSIFQGIADLKEGYQSNDPMTKIKKNVEGIVGPVAGTIAGAAQTVLAPVTPAISKIAAAITPKKVLGTNGQKLYDAVAPKIQALVAKHPESSGIIGDVINDLLLATGVGEASDAVAPALKDAFSSAGVQGAKDSVTGSISDASSAIKGKLSGTLTPGEESAKIQETISPKPTAKEARLAQSEGRLVKGQKPTLLKAGTEDTVLPSSKVVRATKTIMDQIPGAAKMDDSTLYNALNDKVTEIAQNLKGDMQKVPIENDTVQKITDDWTSLKDRQMTEADANDEANVKKEQSQFENRLKTAESGNMNDLWDARKAYDDSVPDNVKNANQMSSEGLQAKKARWLQNRAVLNDAINDTENGLGEASRKSFSDMSDMYNAKEGISSKAKIDLKAKPSVLSQYLKENPIKAKVIKGTIGASLGALGGGLFGENGKDIGGAVGGAIGTSL